MKLPAAELKIRERTRLLLHSENKSPGDIHHFPGELSFPLVALKNIHKGCPHFHAGFYKSFIENWYFRAEVTEFYKTEAANPENNKDHGPAPHFLFRLSKKYRITTLFLNLTV